jgi:putative ABC transport system permease protein
MNYLAIGLRNILKNRRRSLVTVLAVASGFSSVALFAGYIHNVYAGLARQVIHGELLGHLTISKRGLRTEGRLHPEKYLFSREELSRILPIIQEHPHTVLVTPRLSLSGIVTNGSASTIFVADGIVPGDTARLRADFQQRMAGDLKESNAIGVALSSDLAEILRLKPGDGAVLLTNTAGGQANALDVDVVDVFNTGNAGTNDKFVYLPFELARRLYDIEGTERLVVLLDDLAHTEAARQAIRGRLEDAGFDVEIKTWLELSGYYRQVRDMFDMIFAFIFSIVLTVAGMSVVNSMSMTVVERTREIGTLRALGLRRAGVIRLFATEALALVLMGCATGLLITLLVRFGVNAAQISYQPPSSSNVVMLLIDVDLPRLAVTLLSVCGLGLLAAYFPARRGAREPIIDALGHV